MRTETELYKELEKLFDGVDPSEQEKYTAASIAGQALA